MAFVYPAVAIAAGVL